MIVRGIEDSVKENRASIKTMGFYLWASGGNQGILDWDLDKNNGIYMQYLNTLALTLLAVTQNLLCKISLFAWFMQGDCKYKQKIFMQVYEKSAD